MLFGLVAAVVLAHGSAVKAVAMVFLGLLLEMVGTDVQSGAVRYTFRIPELHDGIDFVPIAIALSPQPRSPQRSPFLKTKYFHYG